MSSFIAAKKISSKVSVPRINLANFDVDMALIEERRMENDCLIYSFSRLKRGIWKM